MKIVAKEGGMYLLKCQNLTVGKIYFDSTPSNYIPTGVYYYIKDDSGDYNWYLKKYFTTVIESRSEKLDSILG